MTDKPDGRSILRRRFSMAIGCIKSGFKPGFHYGYFGVPYYNYMCGDTEVCIRLTEDEVGEAVREYLERKGAIRDDSFSNC